MANRDPHFSLSQLNNMYQSLVEHFMLEEAVKVYMLNLVESTIIADKSHVYVDDIYIFYFFELESLHGPRGCICFEEIIYSPQSGGSFDTRQLACYISLF